MRSFGSRCYSQRLLTLGFISAVSRRETRCGFSTALRIRMDKKKSKYEKWTKESLIKRIQELEGNLVRAEAHTPEATLESATAVISAATPPKKKKPERKIDPTKYSTRLVAFKLAYLGKRYSGFEFSTDANSLTIEEELWKAFVKACLIFPKNPDEVAWDSREYSKCGRTDRGVSAFGQVIAVRVRSNIPLPKEQPASVRGGESGGGEEESGAAISPEEEEGKETCEFNDFTDELPYCRILNRLLPPDIKVLAWCPTTPAKFSARYDCRERQYRYFFTQPALAPLPQSLENPISNAATKVKSGWLDIEAMHQAAKKFEGAHDFRNFCRVDPSKLNMNFERTVFESEIVEVKDAETALSFLDRDEFRPSSGLDTNLQEKLPKVYYFHVRGTAFLWHQIRCMVGVLFLVGQGLEDPSVIDRLLDIEAEPRRPNYQLADEVPLVLWDCIFPRHDKPENALNWVYVGEDNPSYQHGVTGLLTDMWEYWRERKMDELLASQLLNVVSSQADMSIRRNPKAPACLPVTTRIFEGGNKERVTGKYQPLLRRVRLPLPQEAFDKEAMRKGYANAADMREAIIKKRAEAAAGRGEPLPEIPLLEEGAE